MRSRARGRAGLDLAGVRRDGEVGDEGVLGLARAVRDDRGVAGVLRRADGVERLGERADLVDLDEDRVGDAVARCRACRRSVCVTNRSSPTSWTLLPSLSVSELPAVPVVLGEAVLDRDERILRRPSRAYMSTSSARRALLAFEVVGAGLLVEELASRRRRARGRSARPACSRPCRSPRA